MSQQTRRRFLQTVARASGAVAASSVASASFGASVRAPKKLGVALVGLGYYSTELIAPALQYTQHCELRGIVTGSPEKVPIWQKKYGIKDSNVYNYENMHTIANNPDIDIVYIILPTFLHKKYSVIGANAGKHVWCEKPMAMNVNECQEIIDVCAANKVQLAIGYRMQHEPNTQTVIKYAQSRPFGKQQHIISEAGYAGRGFPKDNWKMFHKYGGGALYDMGVYPINAARYATGLEPVAITARHVHTMPDTFIHTDERTIFTLEFKGGLIAQCEASQTERINQLHVDCENGWYHLSPMQEYTGVQGVTSSGVKLNKPIANQQSTQMDNDSLAIINNKPNLVPGIDGLKDIHVVVGGLKSAKEGKRIAL